MDNKTLDEEINSLKELLYTLMSHNNFTDDNVVKCSQKLDNLIVEYQKYRKSF